MSTSCALQMSRMPDLLIAATTSDETNLISCMVGRKLGATHTIARVRDEEYYQDVVLLQDELGLSLSINPVRTSGQGDPRARCVFRPLQKVEPVWQTGSWSLSSSSCARAVSSMACA